MVLRGELEGYASALRLLVGFTIVYGTASVLLFDYVLEE